LEIVEAYFFSKINIYNIKCVFILERKKEFMFYENYIIFM